MTDPITDFTEGQWWVKELDAVSLNGTDDQKRAVAVVHHLLRAVAEISTPAVKAEPTLRASDDGAYAVSQDVYWRYDLAPRSTKIFLLNAGGVAIAPGPWSDGCIAWHPLFKRDKDEELKRGIS